MTSARGRPPPGSPDLPPIGREISGFEEMWAIRWSAASRIRRSASQKSVSEGLWPGRCWTSSRRSPWETRGPVSSGLSEAKVSVYNASVGAGVISSTTASTSRSSGTAAVLNVAVNASPDSDLPGQYRR